MPRTVYVVQKQHKWDRGEGTFVPKFDLSPAENYGRLEYLLPPTASPFRVVPLIKELHDRLREYTPDDYLLLVGNPVLIGCAAAIAAEYGDGSVRFLQWSGRDGTYIPVLAEIFELDEI